MKEPHVYIVEFSDSEDADSPIVTATVAMSLLEAMQYAVFLHNDSYGSSVTIDAVTKVELLTSETLYFSKEARVWFSKNYSI